MWKPKLVGLAVITLWCGTLPGAATGAVDLRFAPLDQNISVAEEATLSIMLDEPLEVRTIEVNVTFSSNVLAGVDGGSGTAFQDLPCFVWEEYTPEENQWSGFAVSMGADCFVVGPGELYTWNFVGSADGVAQVTAVSVSLYDRFGVEILDVNLPATTVVVGDVAAIGDFGMLGQPEIMAVPNPANPMTHIKFWLPVARQARLGIYDLKGRQVRSLLDGTVPAEWSTVPWNGRSDSGQAVPSGIYFYHLETNQETLSGRVTLVR